MRLLVWAWVFKCFVSFESSMAVAQRAGDGSTPGSRRGCSVAEFGAVPDNTTDNTAAFRKAAAACAGGEMLVPQGVWMTGPFNLTSNTVLRVEGTISGSQLPANYPLVVQQPLDEAYRAPYMKNRQRQALISSYSSRNITVTGTGTIDGNGWPWWRNVTVEGCGARHDPVWQPNASQQSCAVQRPKLVEFIDCHDVLIAGTSADNGRLTFKNSPFWTLHPTFCDGVRMANLTVLAPRDHGNTVRTYMLFFACNPRTCFS